jgi:hypothetical protein
MFRNARVDANQSEIVKALRKIGATVLILSQLKNAFDLLVGYRSKLFIVEIKDGSKPPSQRKLTEGEMKCKSDFERVGITYNVVNNIDEAINLLTDI